jgi:hypothetical protein
MPLITLAPSLTPRLRFGNNDSAAGKVPTPPGSSDASPNAQPVSSQPVASESPSPSSIVVPSNEAPSKKGPWQRFKDWRKSQAEAQKQAAQAAGQGASTVAPPKKSYLQRFKDWRKSQAEAQQQAAQAAGQGAKPMSLWKKGLIGVSLVVLGGLGVKGCDAGKSLLGPKTDPTHQVDPLGGSHGGDSHNIPAVVGHGGGHVSHTPPVVVSGGTSGAGHGAPVTGGTVTTVSPAVMAPIEGKILGFYFQSAELCEKALAKNRTKLIAGIREHGQQFEPPLGLGDIAQVETGLKDAKDAMAAAGVTYALVTQNAAPPTPAQSKAFRDYIVAANQARVLLEQATPSMLFLPSGITTAPHPAAQLHQDLAGLIESSGFEDAYMALLGKLGRGTAGYQSPWGLTLENMAQDVKRYPWP